MQVKSKVIFFLGMVMLAGVLQAAEMFYIVKLTDMSGSSVYKVMNDEEYKAAYKEVQDEMKIFNSVMAQCKKEWSADKTKESSFPSSKIKARKIAKSGATYPLKEKAEAKLERLDEGLTEDLKAEEEKNTKKVKAMDDRSRAREEERINTLSAALEMVSAKMGEQLSRPVPKPGVDSGASAKKKGGH